MDAGLWFVVCGLWFVVCGLWFVVCGPAAFAATCICFDADEPARTRCTNSSSMPIDCGGMFCSSCITLQENGYKVRGSHLQQLLHRIHAAARRRLSALLARFFGAAKGEGNGGDFFDFVDSGFEAANG